MQRFRAAWLKAHRWTALSAGWLLALVGTLGAVLVVAQPLDRMLHPALFRTTSTTTGLSYASVQQRVVAEFGHPATITMRPPREAAETFRVVLRGGRWEGTLYLDPADGREQGRRADRDSVVDWLFRVHSSLLLKDTGKAVLAWVALAYLVLGVTGIALWWPRRWPPSLRIDWRRGLVPGLFTTHRTVGAVMSVAIAVSVATGAYLAWRPLAGFVSTLAGEAKVEPPSLPATAPANANAHAPASLDAMTDAARRAFPDAAIGFVQVPGDARRPVRIRLKLPDDPHPNGYTSLWFDPRDGTLLRSDRWDRLDPGARAFTWVYPLHTGELGGPWHEALVCAAGLALGVLGASGTWLWWKRRRGRR